MDYISSCPMNITTWLATKAKFLRLVYVPLGLSSCSFFSLTPCVVIPDSLGFPVHAVMPHTSEF